MRQRDRRSRCSLSPPRSVDEQIAAGSHRRARARRRIDRCAETRRGAAAGDHRPQRRRAPAHARHAVLRRARRRAGWARVCGRRCRTGSRGRAGRVAAIRGRDSANPGSQWPACGGDRRRGVVPPPGGTAAADRRHGDERQDDLGHPLTACAEPALADGSDRHAGRIRSVGSAGRKRSWQPHDAGPDRPAGDARRAARSRCGRRRHGSVVAQPRSGACRWAHVSRRHLHEPDARPPRLPRDIRCVLRGEGQARRLSRGRRARRDQRRRRGVGAPAPHAPAHHLLGDAAARRRDGA